MKMQQKPLLVGPWRGTYAYDDPEMRQHAPAGVGFELNLTQTRWQRFWGRFTGHVTDDAPLGVPGAGRIRGRCAGRTVSFTKSLPEWYAADLNGLISLREFLAAHGYPSQRHLEHPPIHYDGTMAEDGSIAGTWLIMAVTLSLDAHGSELPFPQTTGTFQMKRS
ncbi:MAG: hypothetical protein K9N47_24225 [Prosthecobacter sp.]|uniref:hypothetical protein n=1 Tax=Prosthecobacter sp. TaxID=1965333 RepID=UPI0026363476|nr:hypothetical protein [Prosthecobacter sp.]MCF7789251.1 hypothetical protein [Prosthecobacter sp.]